MSLISSHRHTSKNRAARTAVLHLVAHVEWTDPGRETVDLAVLTQRSGWRAVIASSGGRLATEAERAAVLHKRLPIDGGGPFHSWRTRLHLATVLQTENPVLLHAHGIETVPYALAISRSQGLPMVADLTQPLEKLPRHKRLLALLKTTRALLRVPSEFMADHLHKDFDVDRERIGVIQPGVDLQWYSAGFISPERLQKISHLWRLPEQGSIVLAPIPLGPRMGHRNLLDVLRVMRDESIFAVLVGEEHGDANLRAEIEGLIGAYGLSGKVVMPDDCPDWPAACWLANVVVAPNIAPRGQNRELLAAQAIGRPVIVTDCGANREMVHADETAWIVPPNDVAALTSALRQAINLTTEERLNLAAATHDFVATGFPQHSWFNGMMRLYETLLYPARNVAGAQMGGVIIWGQGLF